MIASFQIWESVSPSIACGNWLAQVIQKSADGEHILPIMFKHTSEINAALPTQKREPRTRRFGSRQVVFS